MDTTILLSNPDADASVINAAVGPAYMPSMVTSIAVLILFVGLFCFLATLCSTSKSKKYRELITDMYVSASIRKYAQEDKLSLDEELKNFKRWENKQKLEMKELDCAVEAKLKDKISDKVDKELESMK